MPRLLLIEDDDLLREVLTTTLVRAGHTVRQAKDGRQGLEAFRAEPADLVITDLVMPRQEGLETMLLLRREQPGLPIIAISGSATNAKLYLETAARLGADRVFAKPFAPTALLRVIDELLSPPRKPPLTTDENPPP